MMRRAVAMAAVAAGILGGLAPARGAEDPDATTPFLGGLRERGYYDLAQDFLESLRADPETPADVRVTIDYEQGKIMLDEAAHMGDLVRRKDLLDQAAVKLKSFTDKNATHKKAPEAFVEYARLLTEKGHLAILMADDLDEKEKAEKAAKYDDARKSFQQARTAYDHAEKQLETAFKTYPHFIAEGDPRKQEREQVHNALMNAQLQKAVVEYEEGETYPPGSKERKEFLGKGLLQFEELYKKYRTQMAGLTAQMWQGKCYEEDNDLGKALGIYKGLLEHQDPHLRNLQRHVAFFQIIAENKRKSYALAADLARKWHLIYNTPNDRRSREGVGVTLQWAKNILGQLPEIDDDKVKKEAINRATELAMEVAKYSSPWKPEALEIIKKFKPNRIGGLLDVAKLTFEDAITQADQAIGAKDWTSAIALLKQAVRKADPTKDPEKANLPRYTMAFCYFQNKQHYEALAICDHLARRYPRFGMSAKAAKVGMASLADAYNTYTEYDRNSDLVNLIALAQYTAETWPDQEEGDDARMILGQIFHGTGAYEKAIPAYESIRQKSGQWVEAQTRVGASHWELSMLERAKGTPEAIAKADAEVKTALDRLQGALKNRQDTGTQPTDAALINNACDMADIYLDTSRPAEAIAVLDPIVKAQPANNTANSTPFKRLMADMLRAHISNNQVELALADMATLEKAGGSGGGLTQLYFGLGKLLEKEMDALEKKGDKAALGKTQSSYLKFLDALVGSKSGQTYESLVWAGENMLKLGKPKEAGDVFQKVLETYSTPEFLAAKGGPDRIFKVRLRILDSLRDQKQLDALDSGVHKLLAEFPNAIECRFELAQLKEAKAQAGNKKAMWTEAFRQWAQLGGQLERQKPIEYFEAWYHAAYCLWKEGDSLKAKQTLNGIMRLKPAVGSPEMKAKYQQLVKQIK